ncbi:MAG: transcriptional regulator [Fimbriimonadaceae bacterium]|jgi:DNA-binding MarR family transcriptional regulator|nr:transcriptional regulator [Fimbriimonadaceae bacterium]
MSSPSLGSVVAKIDETLHQKARLGIMASLVSGQERDFKDLKSALELTDGNLSTHLSHLEKAGYIGIKKAFIGKRPHTTVTITEQGLSAFQEYVNALAEVFDLMAA